jgi:uncharacterized protein
MKIWVDADACPLTIKHILFRAAVRTSTVIVFVSNQFFQVPLSPYIKTKKVSAGFDVADKEIINNIKVGDLVITADIPLAHAIVKKGALGLNPRGELYTKNNITQRLALRDYSEQLRSSGLKTKGPPKLSPKEIRVFANCIDKLLSKKCIIP